jgi:rod shape-determining protein MreB
LVRSVEVRGRNAETGMPQSVILTSKEMIEAMAEPVAAILDAICRVLERTPDELLAHIHRDGLLLCGGCSRIYGFARLISGITGVSVRQIKDSEHCCARGARIMLQKRKALGLVPGVIHLQEQCSRRAGNNGYPEATPDVASQQ